MVEAWYVMVMPWQVCEGAPVAMCVRRKGTRDVIDVYNYSNSKTPCRAGKFLDQLN